MNAAPYLHLAWKEYRALRGFWLALFVLAGLAAWFVLAFGQSGSQTWLMVWQFALAAPVLFAIGAAGTAFSSEKETGSYEFLRGLPIAPRHPWVAKLTIVIAGVLLMYAASWGLARVMLGHREPSEADFRDVLSVSFLATAAAVAWGTLFSLLTARPLWSVFLALVAGTFSIQAVAAATSQLSTMSLTNLTSYAESLPRQAIVIGMVLAADVLLGLRWLHPRQRSSLRGATARVAPRATPSAVPCPIAEVDAVRQPDRTAALGHLLWQQWRQSKWLMLSLFVLMSLAWLAKWIESNAGPTDGYTVLLLTLAALSGAFVYLPDQERYSFRFFVEHNVSPRLVWLSRQIPWWLVLLVPALFGMGIRYAVAGARGIGGAGAGRVIEYAHELLMGHSENSTALFHELYWQAESVMAMVMVLLAFSAGQWTSMLFKSGVLAAFCGAFIAFLLFGWMNWMRVMEVPWLWSVLPIPAVFLLATWLRASDWIREQASWLARTRALAAVAVPALVLVAALAAYRVYSLPDISPGFDPQTYLAGVTPAALETGKLYRRAAELLRSDEPADVEIHNYPLRAKSAPEFRPLSTAARERFESQREALELIVAASQRGACAVDDPRTLDGPAGVYNIRLMVPLVLLSGRLMEESGDLDAALERYLIAFRVIAQLHQFAPLDYPKLRMRDAGLVFTTIANWSVAPGQTSEQITRAADRLEALLLDELQIEDGIKANQVVGSRFIAGDVKAVQAIPSLSLEEQSLARSIFVLRWLPWERARSQRALDGVTSFWLQRADWVRSRIANGDQVVDYLSASDQLELPMQSLDSWKSRQVTTTWPDWNGVARASAKGVNTLVEFEAQRRATTLSLHLVAYRLQHGALPDSLRDLLGQESTTPQQFMLDPYIADTFHYFPRGLRFPDSAGGLAQPFLWSSGPDLRPKHLAEPTSHLDQSRFTPENFISREWTRPGAMGLRPEEILTRGELYFIPAALPAANRPEAE